MDSRKGSRGLFVEQMAEKDTLLYHDAAFGTCRVRAGATADNSAKDVM